MSCSIRPWTLGRFALFLCTRNGRRGIATAILEACKQAGFAAAFRRFEMTATLTRLRMYLARGYAEVERTLVPLPNGVSFPVVKVGKTIPSVEG